MKKITIAVLFLMATIFSACVYSYYPMPFPQKHYEVYKTGTNQLSAQVETGISDEIVATLIGDVTADSTKELVCFTHDGLRILDGKTGQKLTGWNLHENYPDYKIDYSKSEGFRGGALYDVNHDRKLELIFQIQYSGGSLLIVLNGQAKLLWIRETGGYCANDLKILSGEQGDRAIINTGRQLLDAQTGSLIKERLQVASF